MRGQGMLEVGTIHQIDVWMIALQLKEPFQFAYGTFYELPRVLIRIQADFGSSNAIGWGEAAIDFPFVNYDMFDVYDALYKATSPVLGMNICEREQILSAESLDFLHRTPAAQCALNMAIDDAVSRSQRLSAGAIYGYQRAAGTPLCSVSFRHAIDPEVWLTAPGIIKIKVGQGVSHDLARIEVAEKLSSETKKQYALDFNAAYSLKETLTLVDALRGTSWWTSRLCVAWEQPINRQASIADWMRLLKEFSRQEYPPTLIADESFVSESSGRELMNIGVGLNYKIQKIGGILAAIELESTMRNTTLKSFVGGTFPSPLGRAYDTLASLVMASINLPGDGLLPAATYLSRECVDAFPESLDQLGLGIQPREGALSRLVIEDPRAEFYRIRTGSRPKRIKMEIGGSYAEKYVELSGKDLLWNLEA